MAKWELGSNTCQLCCSFLEAAGGNEERGKQLRGRRKAGLQETSGHGVRHNVQAMVTIELQALA